jgi:tetratricopeptide (TPR) repeat protein
MCDCTVSADASQDAPSQRWLFIYDNVTDFDFLNEFLPTEGGCMIVTTRFDTYSHSLEGNVSRIRLNTLGDDDSLELFNRIRSSAPRFSKDEEEKDGETKELLESIGGLALGIKQMAFFIGNRNLKISYFRRCYIGDYSKKNDGVKLAFMEKKHPKEAHSLRALWDVQFQHIAGTDAAKLLGMLSLASSAGFPRVLLELEQDLTEEEAAWAAERLPTKLLGETSSLTEDDVGCADVCQDLLRLEEAIDLLSVNALLESIDNADQLHIHRLTKQAFLYSPQGLASATSSHNNLQMAFDGLLFILARKFPHAGLREGLWRHLTKCAEYIPHVTTLARTLHTFQNSKDPQRAIRPSDTFIKLMIDAAWYLFEIHDLEECREMLDIASKACEDKRSTDYGFLCNTYVAIALHENDIETGRRYSELAIKIREASLPPGHVTLAHSYGNFGSNLLNECRYDEAVNYFFKSEKIYSDDSHGGGPVVMSVHGMNAMARAYAQKGEITKAIKQIQDIRKCLEETDTKHTLVNVAVEYIWTTRILIGQEQYYEALSGLEKIREVALAKMPTSLELYSIYHWLGLVYLQIDAPSFAKAR